MEKGTSMSSAVTKRATRSATFPERQRGQYSQTPPLPAPPLFVRGPRDYHVLPEAEIEIPAPTPKPAAAERSLVWVLLPILFTVGGFAVVFGIMSASGTGSMGLTLLISLPMMLGSYLVSIFGHFREKRSYRQKIEERDTRYEEMLQAKRQTLARLQRETRDSLLYNDPDPKTCYDLVVQRSPQRLWAREALDEDFLSLRLGLGNKPFQVSIKPPSQQQPMDPDPLVEDAQDLAAEFRRISDVPITLSIRTDGVVGLAGPDHAVHNALCNIVIQIATHHLPHEVKIVAVYSERDSAVWNWIRWLPHVWSEDRNRRFLAQDLSSSHELLDELLEELRPRALKNTHQSGSLSPVPSPTYVFLFPERRLVDGHPILDLLSKDCQAIGACSVYGARRLAHLPASCRTTVDFDRAPPQIVEQGVSSTQRGVRLDPLPADLVDRLARVMAPIRLKTSQSDAGIPTRVTLLDVLAVERVEELHLLDRWKANDPTRALAVPIGRRAGGKIQFLDLHEPKDEPKLQSGHGPNGLVAATVGYGKSELLQSFAAVLAVHFSPRDVALALFDFKPPGMAEQLNDLPHVVNTIDLHQLELVPRALKSLEAELTRRGRLFAEAKVTHIDEYIARHRQGNVQAREPLPYLVLIVDEFRKLKDELPDTMQRFVEVATLGRAFGFRMILATQKPAGVISAQIDANTALRLCLHVEKAEDSQEVIRRPDAAYPMPKGRTYIRVGEDVVFEQFQSAFSGARYAPADASGMQNVGILEVLLDGSRAAPGASVGAGIARTQGHTQLHAVVEHVKTVAESAELAPPRKLWLPPLPERLALHDVRPARGWNGEAWPATGRWLRPTIGLVDDPVNQSQRLLEPDLGRRGHLFICSGAGVDSRNLLRSIVVSLALDHPPDELHFYCLDFGSLGLRTFEELPHTGAVIAKQQSERIDRLFRWLKEEMSRRRDWLAKAGFSSLAEAHQSGTSTGAPPAIVLVIDNLSSLSDDLDTLDILAQLAPEGPVAGIHMILAGDPTAATKFSKLLANVALRIANQFDQMVDYRQALDSQLVDKDMYVPRGVAGRGLFNGPPALECQLATSVTAPGPEGSEAGLRALIAKMRQAWEALDGSLPAPIGELPLRIGLRSLLDGRVATPSDGVTAPLRAPIGLDNLTLEVAEIDLEADGPHFVITGPGRGGKTTALSTWVLSLAYLYSKDQVQFFLLDSVKASLAHLKGLPHVLGYGATEAEQLILLDELDQQLDDRRRAGQRKARPALVCMLDDVGYLESNEIKEVLERLAKHDHLFGFHLIMAGAASSIPKYEGFCRRALESRSGLVVGSNDLFEDTGVFNLTLPSGLSMQTLPPGRAYFVRRGVPRLIQVAVPTERGAIDELVQQIALRERTAGRAVAHE